VGEAMDSFGLLPIVGVSLLKLVFPSVYQRRVAKVGVPVLACTGPSIPHIFAPFFLLCFTIYFPSVSASSDKYRHQTKSI
jgi:hypothetical protein